MYTLYKHTGRYVIYHIRTSDDLCTSYGPLNHVLSQLERNSFQPALLSLNSDFWTPIAIFPTSTPDLSDYPELFL